MNPSMIGSILRGLSSCKTDKVTLLYEDYRRIFSVKFKVPEEDILYDNKEPPNPVMVKLDKVKAIDYIKSRYNFVSKSELTEVITHGMGGTVSGQRMDSGQE